MKYLIILGDGMADAPIGRLGGLTPLQYASTPFMDKIARLGQCGSLITVPDGFIPGSEVAIPAILGYDLNKTYEGRGPLEAPGVGYELSPDDLALRCNLISLDDGRIANHHGGHLTSDEGEVLMNFLQKNLGTDRISFISGQQYRHLLIIKNGNKNIEYCLPHDYQGQPWRDCLPRPLSNIQDFPDRMSAEDTARLISRLIIDSQTLLESHPINLCRKATNLIPANSIWPWGGGYRPNMLPLNHRYDSIRNGAVISAVNLIRGIGHYAGLDIINVPCATGRADTNYKGKADAAIEALRYFDFVFLHIEASDEASHEGNLPLKIRTIENLDSLIVRPIFEAIESCRFEFQDTVSLAILPDHHTSVEQRIHTNWPVPFAIWHPGIAPDNVSSFDETSCSSGTFNTLSHNEFFPRFINSGALGYKP